jgi:tetratricopeptide (TPR) repeat protein
LTGGRELPALKAWAAGDFTAVLDHCDDVIESYTGDVERIGDSNVSKEQLEKLSNAEMQAITEQNKSSKLLIFHRNVKASALNQLGRFAEAVKVSRETVRFTHKKNRDALCLLGTSLNALGTAESSRARDEEALRCFQQALQLLPPGGHDIEASLNEATLTFKLGLANEAISKALTMLNYRTVPEFDPDHRIPGDDSPAAFSGTPFLEKLSNKSSLSSAPEDPFAETGSLKDEDFDDALDPDYNPKQIRQAALDRDHIKYDPDLHMLLCAIYSQTNQLAQAIEESMNGVRALKLKGSLQSPLLAHFYQAQLSALLKLERLEEAELVTKMLIKLKPEELDLISLYTHITLRLKRPYETIMGMLDKFESQANKQVDRLQRVLLLKITVQKTFDLPADLLHTCDALLKLGPHPAAYSAKALVLLKLDKPELALEVCKLAQSEGNKSSEILTTKALCLDKLQEWDESLLLLDSVTKSDPSWTAAHFHRGNILIRRGRIDQGIKSLNQALSLNPPDPLPILKAKAGALRGAGRLREAVETYQLAARYDPNIAKDLPTLFNQFKTQNPTNFLSSDAKLRVEKAKQLLSEIDSHTLRRASSSNSTPGDEAL